MVLVYVEKVLLTYFALAGQSILSRGAACSFVAFLEQNCRFAPFGDSVTFLGIAVVCGELVPKQASQLSGLLFMTFARWSLASHRASIHVTQKFYTQSARFVVFATVYATVNH